MNQMTAVELDRFAEIKKQLAFQKSLPPMEYKRRKCILEVLGREHLPWLVEKLEECLEQRQDGGERAVKPS